MNLSCVTFDLDDTLYLERDYVRSGFRAVASALARRAGVSENWFTLLWEDFLAGVRGNSFDKLLAQHPELCRTFGVDDLVLIYRQHEPHIKLMPGAMRALTELRNQGLSIALITDGLYEVQLRKIKSLALKDYFDHIVITGQWGRAFWKPHPRGFLDVTRTLGVQPSETVYIGDNPEKDFVGAKRLGWTTVRLRLPGQLRYGLVPMNQEAAPTAEFQAWEELLKWVTQLRKTE